MEGLGQRSNSLEKLKSMGTLPSQRGKNNGHWSYPGQGGVDGHIILFPVGSGVRGQNGSPPGQGVGSMGHGLYAAVVIIDNDHGRHWGHHYHHR